MASMPSSVGLACSITSRRRPDSNQADTTCLLHSLDHPRRYPTLDRLDVSEDHHPIPIPRLRSPPIWGRQAAKTDSHPILGIPRPSFKSEKIAGDSNETQKWVSRYLAVGETAMDWAVVTAGQSGWFERNR